MTKAVDLMTAALPQFYAAFGETVDIESMDGSVRYDDIAVIISFGEGEEYRGSDALDTEATMRVRVSDIETITSGYKIYRGAETWTVLDGQRSEDNLEWIAPISRLTR